MQGISGKLGEVEYSDDVFAGWSLAGGVDICRAAQFMIICEALCIWGRSAEV